MDKIILISLKILIVQKISIAVQILHSLFGKNLILLLPCPSKSLSYSLSRIVFPHFS